MGKPRVLVPCCPDAVPLVSAWGSGWAVICPECRTQGPARATRNTSITAWNMDVRARIRRALPPRTKKVKRA